MLKIVHMWIVNDKRGRGGGRSLGESLLETPRDRLGLTSGRKAEVGEGVAPVNVLVGRRRFN